MSDLQILRLAHQIRRSEDVDPVAFALVMTEMRFRGFIFRITEVLYAWCLIFVFRREPRLTLGSCQVSFKYWRLRYGKNNYRLLFGTFDGLVNYEICRSYLSANREANLPGVLTRYNGRPTAVYVKHFLFNLDRAKSLLRRIGSQSVGRFDV